ncbi:hypothetical protein RV04_GL000995 [Enterococcus hermanniensis]|uniref:PNPLA domain-containing protein n=2 Tax=Enterococcus hermanniensis TaxID=249189 RepID=A0A1L8TQK3_9ENTE|nr:hypothetical protein RV04_GL000995 [Enterococcus hermanniensis]
MTSNKDWNTIWKEQIDKTFTEITPISDIEMDELFNKFNEIERTASSAKEWIEAHGKISKETAAFLSNEERQLMIKERLGSDRPSWNSKLRIVATNIETAERAVFTQDSGVSILDALQASSALQGVWPPVEINGKHYFDGGSYSMENPDVVTDATKMLVLSTGLPVAVPYKLESLLTNLENNGCETKLILPSTEVMAILKAFHFNTVEAKIRPSVANAGYIQGQKDAETISKLWK